jgi:hypothetical protein
LQRAARTTIDCDPPLDPQEVVSMNVLDSILNADNGAAVRQIGSPLGLDDAQTASALSALVPALSAGLRQNTQSPGILGRTFGR